MALWRCMRCRREIESTSYGIPDWWCFEVMSMRTNWPMLKLVRMSERNLERYIAVYEDGAGVALCPDCHLTEVRN